ncbi:MAG: response regulator receiver protein [Micrococcaceae bacterium]|nr:response regulator receiver protein [Micrococcaceae bacterium]
MAEPVIYSPVGTCRRTVNTNPDLNCFTISVVRAYQQQPVWPRTPGRPYTHQPGRGAMKDAGQNPFGEVVPEELLELLAESEDIHDFLGGLTVYLAGALSSSGGDICCAVALLRERKPVIVASSTFLAADLTKRQHTSGDGPCLTAARDGITALVPDVLDELSWANHQWREYLSAVAGDGIRTILAVPFLLNGQAKGALALYSSTRDAFRPVHVAAAEAAAVQASPLLRIALRSALLNETTNDLTAAVKSRTVIDLALGIIMAQNRCTEQEAFTILKQSSSARQTKLQVHAAHIVGAMPEPDASTPSDRNFFREI